MLEGNSGSFGAQRGCPCGCALEHHMPTATPVWWWLSVLCCCRAAGMRWPYTPAAHLVCAQVRAVRIRGCSVRLQVCAKG